MPKKIKEKEYKEIEKLAQIGLTIEQICDYIGIHRTNFHKDKKAVEIYKKNVVVLGKKVRLMLVEKASVDTTANIYLDKILNRTIDEKDSQMLQLKKRELELKEKEIEEQAENTEKVIIINDLK